MPFLAVIKLTPTGRIAKHEVFATTKKAEAHVLKYHGLFVVKEPNAPSHSWRFDPVAKTARIDRRPTPPPEPEDDLLLAIRDLADALGATAVTKLENRLGGRRAP